MANTALPKELPDPTIKDLKCPECGQRKSFVIAVSECVIVYRDGTIIDSDSGPEWGDLSYCRCYECDHRGMVWQFRRKQKQRPAKKAVSSVNR